MRQIKQVLAFGDSNAAGCELGGPLSQFRNRSYKTGSISVEDIDAPGKELAFPKIVADYIGVPCYNFAMTGGSNNRSLRLLTKNILKYPDSLVLFSYGRVELREFYYPKGGMGCDKDNFFQAGPDNFDRLHINNAYLEIHHPYNNLSELMLCVESICKLHAAAYLQIPILPKESEFEIPQVENLIEFGEEKNCELWGAALGFKMLEFHYGRDWHEAIAKLLIENLQAKNII